MAKTAKAVVERLKNEKRLFNTDTDTICEKELYLYKIMPFKYFLKTIQTGKLYFSNIWNWDDPYELFFFKQKFKNKQLEQSMTELCGRLYGQSWSKFRDSDALWRIYSHIDSTGDIGVRIQSSLQKICNLFYEKDNNMSFNPYIGFVAYKTKKYIKDWMIIKDGDNAVKDHAIESLFLKRNNFSYEEEFRIILYDDDKDNTSNAKKTKKGIEVDIDINDFIYEVAFDPRLDDDICECLKDVILNYMDEDKRVMKSTLYHLNKEMEKGDKRIKTPEGV